jgi:nitroreductase
MSPESVASDDFLRLVRLRRSVRAYLPRPIEAEKTQTILEAACRAPSAGNLQAYEIIEVDGRAALNRLARAAMDQAFIAEAPTALVFCALPERAEKAYGHRGAKLYSVQDATIACAYAQLAAAALGLGSVWVGSFDEHDVRHVIGAGADAVPVAILPIGYARETGEATTRRALSDLVRRAGGGAYDGAGR